ncbi:SPOR domain-containing protein [Neomoorella humiferrea]|uniref:SPOR domain-containing protein n=1 Tax=Neomoorella humiferrea TaxID=676965 RepID=UPI003D92A819
MEAAAAVSSPKETGTKDGAVPAAGGLDTTVAGIDAAKLWLVQVGAFAKKENAGALAKKLRSEGYDVYYVQLLG